MADVAEAFGKLLERQPTDAEKLNLYRVRDALKLHDNDALWLVLIALEHYRQLYGSFPKAIEEAAREVMRDIRQTTTLQMQAAAEETKRDLAEAVARTSEAIARKAAGVRMFRWAAGCTVAVTAALLCIGSASFRQGRSAGWAQGWGEARREAEDERARSSWASTPEGQLAYSLAQAGSVRELATCSGRGWQRKEDVCFPMAERGSVYGWRVMPTSKR